MSVTDRVILLLLCAIVGLQFGVLRLCQRLVSALEWCLSETAQEELELVRAWRAYDARR